MWLCIFNCMFIDISIFDTLKTNLKCACNLELRPLFQCNTTRQKDGTLEYCKCKMCVSVLKGFANSFGII